MIVVCVANTLSSLSNELERKAYSENIIQEEVWLEVGKEYQVFGICFRDDLSIPWYLVSEEDDSEYPKPHLAAFFKVVDSSIPNNWEFCPKNNNVGDCGLFPEKWANDPSFMEKLVDEDAEAIAYFKDLKNQNA